MHAYGQIQTYGREDQNELGYWFGTVRAKKVECPPCTYG